MKTLDKPSPISQDEQIVVFRLGPELYGVDIFRVSEIVRPQATTRLPQSESHVRGLIDLRGKTIPVLDLGSRLGLPAAEASDKSRVVVVEGETGLVGLAVDEVREVLTIDAAQTEAPPAAAGQGSGEYVRGVTKRADRLIVLLDLDRALAG